MPRMLTEGEDQPPRERSRRAAWLVGGLAALLIGYPVGFVLVMGRAWSGSFTLVYVALAVAAVIAAFGFSRIGRRRSRPG
ncbi:MAG TPA: hypothetical protein VNX21_05490 [Candidatus Thermoplasmatota archaeon]|nr:hypothetical protein [Candidatus Thermoplasmatota archaeon]